MKFQRLPTGIRMKENLAKIQAARGKEVSDGKEPGNVTSKAAERKRKSGTSPVQFCHRRFVGGNE